MIRVLVLPVCAAVMVVVRASLCSLVWYFSIFNILPSLPSTILPSNFQCLVCLLDTFEDYKATSFLLTIFTPQYCSTLSIIPSE